jgi:hypothetical protein
LKNNEDADFFLEFFMQNVDDFLSLKEELQGLPREEIIKRVEESKDKKGFKDYFI